MYDIDDLTMYQSCLSEQNMEHVAESSRALLAWAGDAGLERVLSPRVIPCCPLLASLPDTALCTPLSLITAGLILSPQGVPGTVSPLPSGGPEQIPGPIKLSSAT